MSEPSHPELPELAQYLSLPTPGLALLRYRSVHAFDALLQGLNAGDRKLHRVSYRPRATDERADFMAANVGEVKADGTIGLAADVHHRWDSPNLYRVEEYMATWRNVTAPVLMITGTHSFLFSRFFGKDAPEYRRRIECFRDIKEVMLDDSGHNMHHDEPTAVARLIEEFMLP